MEVPVGGDRVRVLGSSDRNLKMIRETLGVRVTARDRRVLIRGKPDAVDVARAVIERLGEARNRSMSREQVFGLIADESARFRMGAMDHPNDQGEKILEAFSGGMRVGPRTEQQRVYLEAMRRDELTFCIGPAGTGKTYLAVAWAVHLLRAQRVRRLVLVRPAVEAGERLGFLPGDLEAKVNPYLRPLFDALHDMVEYDTIRRFLDSDVVEIVPLAFMRGRTLNNAVIILDEAQNTTTGQMKMFLTRMGRRSRMIVTGDVTQIDLPDPTQSGLVDAARRLGRVPGVSFVTLTHADVVRHDLVQRIVEAYDASDAQREEGT